MRLRSVLWATLAGLALAAVLHSAALVLATLAAAAIAATVVATHRNAFAAFTLERVPSRRVVAWGGSLDITLTLTNDKLLPLMWMRVHDQWPRGLEPQGFRLRPMTHLGRQEFSQTVSIRWFERLRRRYRVRCTERGLHRLGPVELEAGDPFGIAGAARRLEARQEFVVLPRVLDVPGFDLLVGPPLAEDAVDHSLAHDATALRGIRAYRSGDPMRAINWRATARTRQLQTNEFDPASVAAVRLLVDVGPQGKAWEGMDPEQLELLCVAAGSLAAAFDARGYAVGLASTACLANQWRAPDLPASHGGLPDVLEAIARLREYSVCDCATLIAAELADESSAADCVLVTTGPHPSARVALERLRAERRTVVVSVGTADVAAARSADATVPAGLDWRRADALTLLA